MTVPTYIILSVEHHAHSTTEHSMLTALQLLGTYPQLVQMVHHQTAAAAAGQVAAQLGAHTVQQQKQSLGVQRALEQHRALDGRRLGSQALLLLQVCR
jgi:hypothetical protein